ncbi:MAG: EpsG family protein [Lachnospiraceae bacterium]|nr:EpsG family protein [Lachnospiraceae bacterium]
MPGMMLYTMLLAIGTAVAAYISPRMVTHKGTRREAVNRLLLLVLFFMLFIPSALRLYTGNDYYTYIEHFHDVRCGHYVVTEPGFNVLVKLIYSALGGEYFLVVFAVFAFFTVMFFLKGIYRLSSDVALSFFLFLSLGLYFQSYNSVRYYLALAIGLYSLYFVWRRQWGKFVICVLAAALFHKTALLMLILYPASRIEWKKWFAVPLTLLGISGLVFKDLYMKLFVFLYPSYVNEEEYLNGDYFSIVNIARCLAVIALFLIVMQFEKKELSDHPVANMYLKMNILALLLYSCFSFVPFVSRIGYYLNVCQILMIPELICCLKDKKKKVFTALVILAGIMYFVAFLYKADDMLINILPYTTWLSVPDGMMPEF